MSDNSNKKKPFDLIDKEIDNLVREREICQDPGSIDIINEQLTTLFKERIHDEEHFSEELFMAGASSRCDKTKKR